MAKLKADPQRLAEHREKARMQSIAYYRKNRERILARHRADRETDPEGHRAYNRAYAEQHREEINARHRRWRKARREALIAQATQTLEGAK